MPGSLTTFPPLRLNETLTPATGASEAPEQELIVTLADDGKTITLDVGQRFLLNLGSNFIWTSVVMDPNIVSQVIDFPVIPGAQGVYEAHLPGVTQLLANGEPICRQAKPACSMPNRLFEIIIVVKRGGLPNATLSN
jgi:hypothetical protein